MTASDIVTVIQREPGCERRVRRLPSYLGRYRAIVDGGSRAPLMARYLATRLIES